MDSLDQIIGLKAILLFSSPLILALILGGSNVYKVLFLIFLFYSFFILLVCLNGLTMVHFHMDVSYDNDNDSNNSTQRIYGLIWKEKTSQPIYNNGIKSININPDPSSSKEEKIKLSGKDWETAWTRAIMGWRRQRNNNKNDDDDDDEKKQEEEEEKRE